MTPKPAMTTSRHSLPSRGSETTTHAVTVRATPFFIGENVSQEGGRFVFGYRIHVSNFGTEPVQLRRRRWMIIDADGQTHHVEGEGVVGETPVIEPGHHFLYTSYCPLDTEWGTMEGAYTMSRRDGSIFEVRIGRFYLTRALSALTPA